ncbi:hypothetical protein C8Q78DRAFT_793874 [Trametes maxima]|nr:hypothetical protein C8Q78DRAFT_793874 [Trametes maxima]
MPPDTHDIPPFVERWREYAGIWQTQHRMWAAGLRYLRVRYPRYAYYLGLTCPIARVDIYSIVYEYHLIEPIIDPASILVSRTASVTHLMVDVAPQSFAPGWRTFDAFLAQLSQLLDSSSLSHLLISFRDPPDPCFYGLKRFASHDTATEASKVSNDSCYHAQDWVAGLTHAIPTLRYILFDVDPRGPSGWRRTRSTEAETILWEEMSRCQALEVMKAEDMQDHPFFL